jgi:hypothetical protein
MGVIAKWARGVRDRRAQRRAERQGDVGDQVLKRKAAKAQRLQHERLDNKLPR